MTDPDPHDEVIQPVSLEPEQVPEAGSSLLRWGLALLLVGGLGLWSVGLIRIFSKDESPEDPGPAEQEMVTAEPSATPIVIETEAPAVSETETVPDAKPTPPELPEAITLQSRPAGASVLLDGLFVGRTPLTLPEWEPGQRLQLRKAGFIPQAVPFPAEGEGRDIDVTLEMEIAPVRFSGDLENAVFRVNGTLQKPGADGVLELPLAENEVVIEKPGFKPWRRAVTPARAYQRDVQVEFVAIDSPEQEENAESDVADKSVSVTNSLGMEMIRPELPITTVIGSPRGTPGRKSHEGTRSIRLERPFRISKTEVTNAQFAKFDASHSSGSSGSVSLSAPNQPVVNIRWEQAVAFCNWLSEQENLPSAYVEREGQWAFSPVPGTGYRLPTEAEWEGLSRPDREFTIYAWGDRLPPPENALNIAGQESRSVLKTVLPDYKDAWMGPAPVSRSAEGPLGLLGLAGNVQEWVHDIFTVPPPGGNMQVDPMQESAGRFHVIKGAGWRDGTWMDLSIARRRYHEKAAVDVGFRVARYLTANE